MLEIDSEKFPVKPILFFDEYIIKKSIVFKDLKVKNLKGVADYE